MKIRNTMKIRTTQTTACSARSSRTGRADSRQGITLLFVVSMIVLFLLMGTAFVVISNDFYRASIKRGKADLNTVDRNALVHQAFYELIRGPEMTNSLSPMRTQDIMSDMYGYGFKGNIDGAPVVALVPGTKDNVAPAVVLNATDHFIELRIRNNAGVVDQATNLLTGANASLSSTPGQYNGNIISFVSGPAKGVSTRIVDYQVEFNNAAPPAVTTRKFIVLLPSHIEGGNFALADLDGNQVIVNGRAFGGYGAGGVNLASTEDVAALSPTALLPNRVGESLTDMTTFEDLVSGQRGYMSLKLNATATPIANPEATNESYDAPDVQNMYMSGKDSSGDIIGSFIRKSLSDYHSNTDAGGPANRHMFGAFDGGELEVDNDNDSELDSIWMDLGLTVLTSPRGVKYRPLVAYHVVDMDALVNLNLAGNLADMRNGSVNFAGQGYGPAELRVLNVLSASDYSNILQGNADFAGRHGLDQVPGAAGRDAWSQEKLFGYPDGLNTVGGFFGSASVDIRGRFRTSRPAAAVFLDLNDPTFNSSLPVMDYTASVAADDGFNNSPYEANFAPVGTGNWEVGDDDQLFTPAELERMLRPFDVDSLLLSGRLTELASGVAADTDLRKAVTTESYEVPMAPAFALDDAGRLVKLRGKLLTKLAGGGLTGSDADLAVRELLGHELQIGMKMDVNRVFGNGEDNSTPANNVIDDPDEVNEQNGTLALDLNNDFQAGTNDHLARMKFAKQLYVLTLLTTEDDILSYTDVLEYRTAIAQWAINVVDFRDPDSIHTPFEFDLNPWNGWDVDGEIAVGETNTGDRWVVWGVERPELLLTESSATHDRRSEDLDTDDGGSDDTAGGDADFDSRLIPQTSLFIELYHPWAQDNLNQILPAELGEVAASPVTGVDLQRLTPSDHPVWRIGVKRDTDESNPILRSVYFTNTAPTAITDGGEAFFTPAGTDIPIVTPGSFAVVGSSGNVPVAGGVYKTTFGRLPTSIEGTAASLLLDQIRSISLVPTMDPTDPQIVRFEWDGAAMAETETMGIAIPISQPRSLSASDPTGGYAGGSQVGDGFALAAANANDIPFDSNATLRPDTFDRTAIWTNGTTDEFRVLVLQRLANPLRDWHVDQNPYITIDMANLDLLSFNGIENDPSNNSPAANERVGGVVNGDTDFASTERGENQTGTDLKVLFRRDFGEDTTADGTQVMDSHNFSYQFEETFGRVNSSYAAAVGTTHFAWLTWNNRPYVSHLELANVPVSAPHQLTQHFSVANAGDDPYTTVSTVEAVNGNFGHLLNFYGFEDGTTNLEFGNYYRVLDYLEVPSRYVGTEKWTAFPNSPHNFISNFRYPGKININTMRHEEVYQALMGSFSGTLPYAGANGFDESRWRTIGGAEFFRPYRNSMEGNLVATGIPEEENVDCGLYRRDTSGAALFDVTTETRDAYFRNEMRQRLGNLTTTRSSVFAIWITVGYFEVNEDGTLKDVATGGIEVGLDEGEAVRNRGFYVFDRSIPMAFEPGKNHNIERGILIQSIIE